MVGLIIVISTDSSNFIKETIFYYIDNYDEYYYMARPHYIDMIKFHIEYVTLDTFHFFIRFGLNDR